MHFKSLTEGKIYLNELKKKNETLGTVHTLGALHNGHGILIQQSAKENQNTIVTIYPNKIQLFPGLKYRYDLNDDVNFALANGATAVISSTDEEMFPDEYRTFIDQGLSHRELNSSVFPYAARGQITGSLRWINFTKPNRSYFGLKDIEQAILVKRAVTDLLIDCEIRYVPCIRFSNGVPISSRLMSLDHALLEDVGILYEILNIGRGAIINGEKDSLKVLEIIDGELKMRLKKFKIIYTTIVDINDFKKITSLNVPFIIHAAIQYNEITHFDGLLIRNETELVNGPPVIWLE
jgi:pantoate--beta-alanine ligase